MPLIDLYLPADSLAPGARNELVDELTTVLLRAERAPDTQLFRDITWAYVHEFSEGQIHTAGQPAPQPAFRVQVTVPQGALSDRRKQELVSEATRAIGEKVGLSEADGLRVWVLINEVPEGNWGAAGNIVQFEMLRQAAAAEREQAGQAATVVGAG